MFHDLGIVTMPISLGWLATNRETQLRLLICCSMTSSSITKERNGLESLEFKTVDYGWLYANDYERELGFDQTFCSLARYYRIERNMIHFPLAGASENQMDNLESANVNGFDHTAVIRDFIEKSLVPLFEAKRQQYNLNFSNIS